MRKIEQEMIEAIKNGKAYQKDNTRVAVNSDGYFLKVELHGHVIAEIYATKQLRLSDCGFQTKTTKSRLNAILSHFNLPTISTKNFQWYIGDEKWKGNKTFDISKKDAKPQPREFDIVLGGQSQPRPSDAVLGGKR